MYIHIGNDRVVLKKDVLAVFDLDSATVSKSTRDYLKKAEKEKRVTLLGYDLPKSFLIMRGGEVYLSPFNSSVLVK